MSSDNFKGIIELGTASVKCIIFKINDDNISEILSFSKLISAGIHNGVIINISKASDAVRSCISNAEKKANLSLKKINIVLEQPEFLCTKLSKNKKIDGSKIHKDDIDFLLKEAKKQVTLNDENQSIVHIFNHNYIVDGKIFIEEPIGVYANYLSHEMTFIAMPKNNIRNINQVFSNCDIEIERLISSTFATGVKLLNNNQLKYGSVIIDIGFEKTSLGLFKDLTLVNSITFPIGANHLTKDIAKVCSLTLEESENLRNNIDFSFSNNQELFDENNYLKKIYFSNSSYRKISKSLILNIAQSRIDEIFEIIKKHIVATGININSDYSIILVGGGSNLINIEKLCSNLFNSNIKKINKIDTNDDPSILDENFISCLGAIKIIKDGWETEAIPEPIRSNSEKNSFFSKIFRDW
jgi:cell division protein FtsA